MDKVYKIKLSDNISLDLSFMPRCGGTVFLNLKMSKSTKKEVHDALGCYECGFVNIPNTK